jgi:hypothetical protein
LRLGSLADNSNQLAQQIGRCFSRKQQQEQPTGSWFRLPSYKVTCMQQIR